MKKFEEMGADPEMIKTIAKKVKDVIAYQKGKNMTHEEIATYAIKTHANKDIDPEKLKKKVKVITTYIDKVVSGEIDIEKFKKYGAKFGKK